MTDAPNEETASPDAQYIGDSIVQAGEAIADAISQNVKFDPLDRGHDIASMLDRIGIALKHLANSVEQM